MGKPSRDKGRRGEQELARYYRDCGFEVRRTQRGESQTCDLDGLRGVSIEVKRVENLNVWKAMGQAITQAGSRIPALHFRRNSGEWFVCLRLDDFLALYQDSYDVAGHIERKECEAL
jgi:hypothetical protein